MDTVFIIKGKIDGDNALHFEHGPYTQQDHALEASGILTIHLANLFPKLEGERYDATLAEFAYDGEGLAHIRNCLRITGVVGVN